MKEIEPVDEEFDGEYEEDPEAGLMETEVIKIRDDGENGLEATTALKISDIPEEAEEKPKVSSPRPAPKKKKQERKLKPAARLLLRIILVTSLITGGWSGFQLYLGNKAYREGMNAYSKLSEKNTGNAPEEAVADDGLGIEYTPADFKALAEINSDIVGWITIPGTQIDYPIVQGPDNEYYLEHLFTKETNHTGCVFIDVTNHRDFSDQNNMLYAHHMRNGSMFSDLEGYRKEGFLEEHPYFVLQTLDAVYRVEPFADVLGDAYSTYNQTSFTDNMEFMNFIDNIRANSTFQTDTVVTEEDQILGLSTCRYDASEGRYAVFGKMVRVK